MNRLASREGYLMIDDRASGGKLLEAATVTCAHCQLTWVKNPQRTRPRAYCAHCNSYVCDNPVCRSKCLPFMQQLEQEQTRIIHAEIRSKLYG